jgi:hypothetical protein
MRTSVALALVALAAVPTAAQAQGPGVPASMPLVVDMQKMPLGSWADYTVAVGSLSFTSRWALVARDAKSNTVEMTTTGKPIAKPIVLRVVLPADPAGNEALKKPMVVQLGDEAPMLVPKDMPPPRFQRPEATALVGTEEVKVPAGTFKTSHYRDQNAAGTVDMWVSDGVHPIGIVKVVNTPQVDKNAPTAMQAAAFTQELAATGKGAKPAITKKPQPYDEKKVNGLVGGGH